jgi:cell division protein FtsZ
MAQAHMWAAQVIDGMADFLRPGMVCTDLADMRILFTHSGMALGGIGRASGRYRTSTALHRALTSPWFDATLLAHAHHVLLMVTGSPDLTLYNIHEVAAQVRDLLSPDAWIVFGGLQLDEGPPETLQVMLLAGGLDRNAEAPSTCWI